MIRKIEKPEEVAEIAKLLTGLVLGGIGITTAYKSIYTVHAGQRAIVFNRFHGIQDQIQPEGTHFAIPWIERPIMYDIRAQPELIQSTSGTRDLQMVNIGVRVLARPFSGQLPTIYRNLGKDYKQRVLPSIVEETLKAVVAQYHASELLTQREKVSREVGKLLIERAARFNIVVDDVSITALTFGDKFNAAIEAKQIAAQEAERAQYIVEKAEQDKKGAILRAQGEAKSAELIGKAVANNSSFLELRRIEAARAIAKVVSTSSNKVYLDSNDLLLNIQQKLGITPSDKR